MKIIIMNGPPQSGKDSVCRILRDAEYPFMHVKFAQPIRDAMCSLLGIRDDEIEDYKAQDPNVRAAMIGISEDIAKKYWGQNFFAERAARTVELWGKSINVLVSDGGFSNEVEHFIKRVRELMGKPVPMVQIWQIHRPGHTFRNDSREWVRSKAAHNLVIYNTTGLEALKESVLANAEAFWGKP